MSVINVKKSLTARLKAQVSPELTLEKGTFITMNVENILLVTGST